MYNCQNNSSQCTDISSYKKKLYGLDSEHDMQLSLQFQDNAHPWSVCGTFRV